MKTFEEKFSAWVDGELKGEELAQFELELAHVESAQVDRIAAKQIGDLCRKHGSAPELKNADFFNHQLMQQIEADGRDAAKAVEKPQRAKFFWSLPKLALAGAFTLVVAFGLYHTITPTTAKPQEVAAGSMQVTNVTGGDPGIVATTYQQDNVTVLWLDGLQYLPEKKVEPRKKEESKKKSEPEKSSTEKF